MEDIKRCWKCGKKWKQLNKFEYVYDCDCIKKFKDMKVNVG